MKVDDFGQFQPTLGVPEVLDASEWSAVGGLTCR